MTNSKVTLLCNPRAGGGRKQLARILNSPEARSIRFILTHSVDELSEILTDLLDHTNLLCLYGGDGTIQRVVDVLVRCSRKDYPHLAFIGGGTMNVTATWCGHTRSPYHNLCRVLRAYRTGSLHTRWIPLLRVTHGSRSHHCFTFGMGTPVRMMDVHETGTKGKIPTLRIVASAIAASWCGRPLSYIPIIQGMEATIEIDDERLLNDRFIGLFCNTTGKLNLGVRMFPYNRTDETFYFAAYAISARELSLLLPRLIRGWIPRHRHLCRADPTSDRCCDRRYVNTLASHIAIHTQESLYTVDGEIFSAGGNEWTIDLGPHLPLITYSGTRRARDWREPR